MKWTSGILAVVCMSVLGCASTPSDSSLPHLETRGGVRQLIVDGKPFLVLGGELRNSSSSSRAYMKSIWPKLVEKKLNTVLAAISWEMIEPEEGQFDFSSVDGFIEDARKHNMKVIFLWGVGKTACLPTRLTG
jgi:beta-galactosidase GanA